MHGLSQDLETGCPIEGFIEFWVSEVWYKVHPTNEINHIYIYMFCFFFMPVTAACFVCIVGVALHALSSKIVIISKS